jgi:DNA-binding XRE family transcriptional regulator
MTENWFKTRREHCKLTQRDVAAAVGFTVPLIGFWENDKATPPARVARALAAKLQSTKAEVLEQIAQQSERLYRARVAKYQAGATAATAAVA